MPCVSATQKGLFSLVLLSTAPILKPEASLKVPEIKL